MAQTLRIGWVALALLLTTACMQPSDQRPGFALSGELQETLPTDWSFSDEYGEIAVQVATPYGVPHSVTIWCASLDGQLFLGARNPETKSWPGWVDAHPDVRLKLGEKLYDVRLTPLKDEARLGPLRAAYAAKYKLPAPGLDAPPTRYWQVVPRG